MSDDDDDFSVPAVSDAELMAASAYLVEAYERKQDNPQYFSRAFQNWRVVMRRWIVSKRKDMTP